MWFFRVHWGSLEVIGELFGVHLEFDRSHLDFVGGNWGFWVVVGVQLEYVGSSFVVL